MNCPDCNATLANDAYRLGEVDIHYNEQHQPVDATRELRGYCFRCGAFRSTIDAVTNNVRATVGPTHAPRMVNQILAGLAFASDVVVPAGTPRSRIAYIPAEVPA